MFTSEERKTVDFDESFIPQTFLDPDVADNVNFILDLENYVTDPINGNNTG